MIAVADLGVRFGTGRQGVQAVDGVSFQVAPGEAFGLVGESGSGKSTVLRTIAGLNPAWTGEIRIAGRAVAPRRDRAFHRRVQMVFQDPYGSLHPRHTVETALAEPVAIQGLGDADRRVAAALAAVGLGSGFRWRYPHQLSGGQRQRVAIARALILQPDVLLLDEPTSALDVSVQAEILNLLADIRADTGMTMILVSHDLAVVAHLCDRVGVMNHGRLLEILTVDALRAGRTADPYSGALIAASRGYGGAAAI